MTSNHDDRGKDFSLPNSDDAAASEPIVAPFQVVVDFREAICGWQFTGLPDLEAPGRFWTVPVKYEYLEAADYAVEGLSLYIVRYYAQELLAALQHWPESIAQQRAELLELQASGASCLIVIEGDVETIAQVLSATDLVAPWDPLSFHWAGCDIPWLLVESRRTAEQIVFEIMRRAWQKAQSQVSTPPK